MIYILVKCSGSYDDYIEENILASFSLKKLESKMAEFVAENELILKASNQLNEFRLDLEKQYPEPIKGSTNRDLVWIDTAWVHPDTIDFKKEKSDRYREIDVLVDKKAQ